MQFPIPESALLQHTAILGKTGAGKTTTAKAIVEHVVAEGARVCVLDPRLRSRDLIEAKGPLKAKEWLFP